MKIASWMLLLFGAVLASPQKPNILIILTDDQDLHMNSMDYMPLVKVGGVMNKIPYVRYADESQKYITDEGVTLQNHYCTVAVCCPSRATLWTGHAAHNTNVTDVIPPYGGWPKVVQRGWNDNYLPVWLQKAGYNTYYTGKLWNYLHTDNYNRPPINGFNGSEILIDPWTYQYYEPHLTRNGRPPQSYSGQYSTDLIKQKALGFLEEAVSHQAPWFLTAAPIGPHAEIVVNRRDHSIDTTFPQAAQRHAHLFNDYKIPRDSSFNAKTLGAVSWIKSLQELNDTVIGYNYEFQRARLRALQAVDELVEALVQKLDDEGVLNNTYIFYTTDNGFHISQHRMVPGKSCGYETDIHIPLVVRGPGIEKSVTLDAVTSHIDIAPTILSLVGTPKQLDGKVIPLTGPTSHNFTSEHAAVEFWGYGDTEGDFATGKQLNNTYKGLRLTGQGYSLYYSVWCTNEVEYYDIKQDPGQMNNLASPASNQSDYILFNRPLSQVIPRLNALLMVLKTCKVTNLEGALDASYDQFFRSQPLVTYSACEMGYIRSAEGTSRWNVYDGTKESSVDSEWHPLHYGNDWSLFT
ncbi:hypothetical protein JX265_009386 [Neoarthrinium moseri]|uniref:Arylsulfatase n=1 Tax=Neoarthrinium moseri TaxID=1658444 RepID=A0A9P9WGC8_9PEZI|nr:hypothetical protein JX265_009386 [Neoarthrinium moseri]